LHLRLLIRFLRALCLLEVEKTHSIDFVVQLYANWLYNIKVLPQRARKSFDYKFGSMTVDCC